MSEQIREDVGERHYAKVNENGLLAIKDKEGDWVTQCCPFTQPVHQVTNRRYCGEDCPRFRIVDRKLLKPSIFICGEELVFHSIELVAADGTITLTER